MICMYCNGLCSNLYILRRFGTAISDLARFGKFETYPLRIFQPLYVIQNFHHLSDISAPRSSSDSVIQTFEALQGYILTFQTLARL